jgi:hypothetical protein
MLTARPHALNGSAKKHESPALASLLRCPNCGRGPAIVFPLIRQYDQSVKDAPRVCLKCCYEASGRR